MKIICVLGLILFLAHASSAQNEKEAALPNEKSARYHQLLLKRPDSSTLFERFVDSWLDTGSKENLETFLKASAEAGNTPEWRLLATYQDWMGREEQALQAMTTALEKSPDSKELYFARAKLKSRLLDFEGALLDLEQGKEEAGEEAAILKGTWLARAGRPQDALDAWKELLTARPNDEELREDLIELQVGEGLYDEAIATGRELTETTKDPYQKALRLMRVASVEVMGGKRDEGLATYRKVLDMTGEDSWLEKEILAQVEKVYRRDEDITGLREFYAALREKFPQRVSLRKGLAAQMAANGEIDEAIALFREVLKITPGNLQNRQQFIALLEDAERFELALEERKIIVRDQSEDPAEWEQMARLHDLMGNQEGLLETLKKVHDLRATNGTGVVTTAALYERYQLRKEAGEILREGAIRFPDAIEVTEALASFLADVNSTKEEQAEATQIWLSMAEGADAEGLLRISRALLAHRRAEPCFELLSNRISEFPNNLLLLKQLCEAGLASDQAPEALPYALTMAEAAESPTDLGAALSGVIRLARRLDLQPILSDLENREQKTATLWCVIAELYELQGDLIASDTALAEATKLNQGPLVLSQKVRLLESRNELQKAAATMREIIASPGGQRPIYLKKLVNLLAQAGKWTEALAETDNWKRIAPGDKNAWLRRAEILNESGELEQVVNELRRAVAKFGDEEEEIKSRLATALVEAGEYAEGERLYRKLYEDAEDATGKNRWLEQLATLAQQESRIDELLSEFDRRKRRNSQEAGPLQALAKIHEILGDYEMQREALAEAVRRKPKSVKLWQDLASVEERAGDFDRAVSTLREAARLDNGPQSQQKLADFYFRNNEMELGLDILRGIQSGNAREVESTVLALLQSGERKAALNYLAEMKETDWRLQFLTALAHYQSNKKDEARALLYPLVTVTEEIEGLKPLTDPATLSQWNQWLTNAGQVDNLREFALLGFMQRLTHQFSNYGNQSQSYGGGYGNSTQLQLPGTAEEMRYLAMAFLSYDASQVSVTQENELLSAIPFPKTEFGSRLRNIHRLGEWANEELAAERISLEKAVNFAWDQEKFKTETLQKAATELQETHPAVADLALSGLLNRDPEDPGAILLQRLEVLKKLTPKDRANRLNQLATLLFKSAQQYQSHNYYGRPQVNHQFNQAVVQAYRSILREELASTPVGKKDESGNPFIQTASWFHLFLLDTWQRGDAQEFVVLANRLVEEQAKAQSSANSGMVYYQGHYYPRSVFGSGYGRGGNQETRPPAFPRPSPSIPYSLTQIFTKNNQAQNQNQANGADFFKKWKSYQQTRDNEILKEGEQATAEELSPELLEPVIPQLNSPELRVLAWHWADNEEELLKELKAFEESSDAEKKLTAAGYWFQKQDPLKSYQLLAEARFLPLESAERTAVDGQLALIGMMLAQAGTDISELEIARRAALRLRRNLRTPQQEQQLTPAMIALGLGDVVTQIQTARLRRGALARNRSSSANRGKMSAKFAKALTDGNTDGAAREALRILRPVLRNVRNNSWELEQLTEKIVAARLVDPIIKLAHPGESKSYARRMHFVVLCDSLGKGELALPILKALSAEQPDDLSASAALARYLPEEEMFTLIRKLMNEDSLQELGDFTLKLSNYQYGRFDIDDEKDAKNAILALKVATEFLQTLEPNGEAKRQISWVVGLMSGSVGGRNSGDPFANNYDSEEDLAGLRKEVTRNLLEAALQHPQTAAQGFVILEGLQEEFQLTQEELFKFAEVALKSATLWEEPTQSLTNYTPQSRTWSVYAQQSYYQTIPRAAGLEPIEFLAEFALQQPEGADQSLFNKIQELQPQKADEITCIRALANGDDAAAEEAATGWRQQLDNNLNKKYLQYARLLRLSVLAQVPHERIAEFEFEFLRLFQKLAGSNNSGQLEMAALVKAHLASSEPDSARQFLQRLITETIGPKDFQEEWLNLSNQRQLGYPLRNFQSVLQNMNRRLCEDTQDFETVLLLLDFPILVGTNDYYLRQAVENTLQTKTVKEAEEKLTEINFWERSWAELGKEVPSSSNRKNTLWGAILEKILPYNDRDDLAKKLAQSDNKYRFRQRLAAVALRGSKEKIHEELEKAAPSLLQVPVEQQAGLTLILEKAFPNLTHPKAGPLTKELFAKLGQENQEDLLVAAREKLKSGFEGRLHHYEGRRTIIAQTSKLMAIDAQLAAEYYLTALKEPRNNNQNSSFSTGSSQQASQTDELFEDLMEEGDRQGVTFLQWCRFQVAFEASPEPPLLSAGNADRYDLDDYTDPFWKKLKVPKNLTEQQADLFKNYHWNSAPEAFAKESNEVHKTGAWLMWLVWVENYNFGDRTMKYWNWMQKSKYAERHPIFSDMKQTLLAARSWDKLNPKAQQTAREAWVRTLTDSELSTRFRMEIACKGLDQEPKLSDSTEAIAALTQLYEAYADEKLTLYVEPISDFLTGLGELDTNLPQERWRALLKKSSTAFLNLIANQRHSSSQKQTYARTLIKLAIQLEDWDSCKDTLNFTRETLRGDISLMLDLVEAEQTPLIRQLMVNPNRLYKQPSGLRYSPRIAELSKTLLANIPNEQERYRIHCLIAALSDGDQTLDPNQNQRLTALANEFAEKAPNTPQARNQCLQTLVTKQVTLKPLREELKVISNRFTLAQSTDQDQMPGELSAQVLSKILTRALWYEARQGNLKPADRHFHSLSELMISSDNSYYPRRAASSLFFTLFDGFLHGRQDNPDTPITAEDLELTKEWYLLFANNKSTNYDLPIRRVAFPFCVHALAGKTEDLHNWVQTLPEDQQTAYHEQFKKPMNIPSAWSDENRWRAKDRSELRKLYFRTFFNDHFASKTCYPEHLMTKRITESIAMLRKEYHEVMTTLSPEHPQAAQFKIDAGVSLTRDEGEPRQEGLKLINQGIKIATAAEDLDTMNTGLAELCLAQGHRMKNYKKAIEIADQVDWNRVPEKSSKNIQKRIKEFRKSLAKKDAEKAEKKPEAKEKVAEPAQTP